MFISQTSIITILKVLLGLLLLIKPKIICVRTVSNREKSYKKMHNSSGKEVILNTVKFLTHQKCLLRVDNNCFLVHALINERRLLRFQAPAQHFFERELSNVSGHRDRLHDGSEIYELTPQLE